jgi:predicted protein tyrosine phosphatase
MSRHDAQAIVPSESMRIISITDGQPALLNASWNEPDVLRLKFNDVDGTEEWTKNGGFVVFNKEMANSVKDFVESALNSQDSLEMLVHCHAGISRSAAICKYICEVSELSFPSNYLLYNKKVYDVMTGERWKQKFNDLKD